MEAAAQHVIGDAESILAARSLLEKVTTRQPDREDVSCPETVWAMPIVILLPRRNPPLRHEVLAAAAQAVVGCCLDPRAAQADSDFSRRLSSWYGARIRKVTRRARTPSQWALAARVPSYVSQSGDAMALAGVPYTLADKPSCLDKLQISGTDLPADRPEPPTGDDPVIYLDAGLEMTAGKAAAQAGHASMMMAAEMPKDELIAWATRGYRLCVRELPHTQFVEHLHDDRSVMIVDAGYTEIPANSVTAIGCY